MMTFVDEPGVDFFLTSLLVRVFRMGLRSRGQRRGRPSWWVSVGLLGLSGAARALQLDIEPYSSR
eukprot:17255-Eustigmatos_ZCMA.PRE.1